MTDDYKDPDLLERLYHDEGLTQAEIGDRFGVNDSVISRLFTEYGIETDTSRYYTGNDYKDAETLRELYHDEELTLKEIGERADVSGTTIRRWMQDLDVETARVTKQSVIDELQRLHEELGRVPKQQDMHEHGEHSLNAGRRQFGSWNAALEAAGFESRPSAVTKDELSEAMRRLAAELGRPPRQIDMREHGGFGVSSYHRKFGSWNDALVAVDLDLNYHDERIAVECANCGMTLERLQSNIDSSEYQYCDPECLNEHKKDRYAGSDNPSWNSVEVECDNCGNAIYKQQWDVDRYERHYCDRECWADRKETLTCEYCNEDFEVWRSIADATRFCSIDCAGDWRSENITGEDHPRWRGGYGDPYYGPNWHQQRRRRIIADQARCRDCGLTEAASMQRMGESLSVHHLTRIKEFVTDGEVDHEQANQLDNLITVCRRCHSIREGNKAE